MLIDRSWLNPTRLKPGENGAKLQPQGFGDVVQFDHIQPPLTGLILADEGLRLIEPLGNLDLG